MNAKIAKQDELSHFLNDKNSLCLDLTSYFRLFGIHRIVNRLDPVKSQGIPVYDLLVLLSLFGICGESIFSFYRRTTSLLSLSFFDGVSHVSLDFSLHAEKGKKGNYGMSACELSARSHKKRPCGSPGSLRSRELDQSKLDVALQTLKRAWKHGLRPCYVVMDNWFDSHNFISGIRRMGNGMLHVICTIKKSKTQSFLVQGKKYNATSIVASRERLHARTCREYKCRYIRLDAEFSNIPVGLFFIQYGKERRMDCAADYGPELEFQERF